LAIRTLTFKPGKPQDAVPLEFLRAANTLTPSLTFPLIRYSPQSAKS
jgi:hypothetical protein